ncbi:MAG: ribonuclease P protein component [Bacteroidales bacterium]|jgi:ribonuclease P protein component|nr:ribonuclease P protein component [Bacteroidales bacterium]
MIEIQRNVINRDFMLKKRTEINDLFVKGERISGNLLNVFVIQNKQETDAEIKIFISVPKKKIKKAHNRNLIKRRIKEAIRLNLREIKELCVENRIVLHLGFVYTKFTIEKFGSIQNDIIQYLNKIQSNLLLQKR